MLGQRLAHRERHLRAQNDIALHVRAAQVDVAILEARVFLHVHVLFHRERRRARFVQDPEFFDHQFHFAGRDGRVDGFGRAQRDHAFDGDHVFGGKQLDFLVNVGVAVGA